MSALRRWVRAALAEWQAANVDALTVAPLVSGDPWRFRDCYPEGDR